MGHGYNHHHYLHHQNMQFNDHKVTFLQFLCLRPSIKDVSLPKWQHGKSGDPNLSPKIGCIGQIKRYNKIVGCPVSHKFNISTKNNNDNIKYLKLKKLFSGKNLTITATAPATTATTRSTTSINIENMDPPLPVIKRGVAKQGDNNSRDTLWQRRSRGTGLKSLQLQQVQLNSHQEPITI